MFNYVHKALEYKTCGVPMFIHMVVIEVPNIGPYGQYRCPIKHFNYGASIGYDKEIQIGGSALSFCCSEGSN
jgi:hypothetical protein